MNDCPAKHDLAAVSRAFDVRGEFVSGAPYGTGHINDTYAVWYDEHGTRVRYIHQRINHEVFREPLCLMDNITRVTGHLRSKLIAEGADDVTRRALTLIPTVDGADCHIDEGGNHWRTYIFIEDARTYDQIENAKQAYEAAKAFGRFQFLLSDLPAPRLHETIPGFHHTPARFKALLGAVEKDSCNRAASAKTEIDFALGRESVTPVLVDMLECGELPERITHNDTKLNNVMIDDETSEGVCVIDLDTVMPGLSLYDFGDMVRSGTRSSMEDERDLSKVAMLMPIFEELARGYLASAGGFLTAKEKEFLVFSGRLITFEIGLRFLTDYLEGDKYFKTHRDGHNLDRCRVQFKHLESMEAQADAMEQLVAGFP